MKLNIISNMFWSILFSVHNLQPPGVKYQNILHNPLHKKASMDESLKECFCLVNIVSQNLHFYYYYLNHNLQNSTSS